MLVRVKMFDAFGADRRYTGQLPRSYGVHGGLIGLFPRKRAQERPKMGPGRLHLGQVSKYLAPLVPTRIVTHVWPDH